MKRNIKTSKAGSKYIGTLPLGCQLCMRGQKMVLFMGGTCNQPKWCSWYCPISKERKNSEQIYANEIRISNPEGAIQEGNLIRALGCSFTGGDPLRSESSIAQILLFLKELKKYFSKDFHTHLYTSGQNFTPKIANKLSNAGLDEIRFHLEEKNFHRIQYAMDLNMEVGVEVPVIPDEKYKIYLLNLIDYLDNIGVSFINLNEFEMNGMNFRELKKKGFTLKDNTIASVEGSQFLAEEILKELPERYIISVHYCPISLKDGPQLRNRYKRRAETIRKPYEEITDDGTLVFLRLEGSKKEIIDYYLELLNESRVPKKMMDFKIKNKQAYLDLPWFLSKEKTLREGVIEYNLKAGIMEILPFRDEYFEICEYTPIELRK